MEEMGIDGELRWNGWFDMSPFLGEPSFMKTTLDLPDDLMREVKIRAAQQGKKLKDVMADTLRSGLGATPQNIEAPRAIIAKHPVLGFPTVKCAPNSAASQMTPEELLQLEQEALTADDLKRAGIAV